MKETVQNVLKNTDAPYFFKITSYKREKIRRWLEKQEGMTYSEKVFLQIVKNGLDSIKYDYWISTIEPTINKKTGKIEFIEGTEVAVGYSCNQWKQFSESYMPRKSRMAKLYELFLWYAWRIVKGYWTLDYVANNSSSAGNFKESPNHYNGLEKSSSRKVGGFYDGIGNTYKIVMDETKYVLVGDGYYGDGIGCTVCGVCYSDFEPDNIQCYGSGVVVFT